MTGRGYGQGRVLRSHRTEVRSTGRPRPGHQPLEMNPPRQRPAHPKTRVADGPTIGGDGIWLGGDLAAGDVLSADADRQRFVGADGFPAM